MKHLLIFLVLLFGSIGCYGGPEQLGLDTPNPDPSGSTKIQAPQGTDMSRRINENKPVVEVAVLHPVAVVQPAAGWWSGSGNLGTEVPFGPDAQNRQTILSLPEYGMPETWTISLYLTQEVAAFNAFSVKARVEFGGGGSTQIVELDWTNGTQITLPMNAVNVIAEYSNVDITTIGSGIRLGVQIAKGRRGGTVPPRLTMLEDVNVPTGASLIEIPAFASRIKLFPATVGDIAQTYSNTTLMALFSGNGGGAFETASISGDLMLASDGLEVSGSARFVKLINLNAAAIHLTMIAELFG
jgi:hypothetical protein